MDFRPKAKTRRLHRARRGENRGRVPKGILILGCWTTWRLLTGNSMGCRLAPTVGFQAPGQIHPFEKFRRDYEKSPMGHAACFAVAIFSAQLCAESELRCWSGVAGNLLPHQSRAGRSVLERPPR